MNYNEKLESLEKGGEPMRADTGIFLKRFALTLPLIIMTVGLFAFIWLPKNPPAYLLFVAMGMVGALIAMRGSW